MIRELIQSAHRPREISAMVRMKISGAGNSQHKETLAQIAITQGDMAFCYAALQKVSRSFAAVIQQLPLELRDPVCIFYLVLRGLDSVEDDATVPNNIKLPLLRTFYLKNNETGWRINGVGDSADYRTLLANYHKVSAAFRRLEPKYQLVINDICKQMGEGMAEFAERSVKTLADYDLYCHYVAGLVGIGLSDLFAGSGLESGQLRRQQALSNSMGLFLQKTNIVRDYHEDLQLGRRFWPRETWGKYVSGFEMFEQRPTSSNSLACLNELVCDALRHSTDSLEYMQQLRNPAIFRFCAIPQVMAMATLAEIYNNPDVYTSVVKIRKGLTARLMMEVTDYVSLTRNFQLFAKAIENKLNPIDPSSHLIRQRLQQILEVCQAQHIAMKQAV
ncbi:hypothetical protein BH09BAC1_BH09BAC1_06580 [soil metagenome]